jgi:magnesium transporter
MENSGNKLDNSIKIKSKVGLPPGTPVHTGIDRTEAVTIEIAEYNPEQMREYVADCIDDASAPHEIVAVKWIHVNGVHDIDIIQKLGEFYDLHPLILEDIPSIGQRPKIELLSKGVYVVLRAFDYNPELKRVTSEQITIILGDRYVVSFQETSKNLFESVLARLRVHGSIIQANGPDYLMYTLLDLLVDKYFYVLEQVGEEIENLEDELVSEATSDMLNRIYRLKRVVISLRRFIWPLREVAFRLSRESPAIIQESTQVYMRDLYDHVIRVADLIETYRETTTGMLEIYLSSVSNRMNEVMQLLTVISTIFIPLTLMTSIYGMNWPWMPELEYEYGYPIFILFMIAISVVLLWLFKKKGWI